MERLEDFSQRMQGARDAVLALKEWSIFDLKKKDDKLYADAVITFILADFRNMNDFLLNRGVTDYFRFYEHKRDSRGKLVSVKFGRTSEV